MSRVSGVKIFSLTLIQFKTMVYNLSFITYAGDEMKQLKDEIEATSENQTVEMQRMTGYLKQKIETANKNQTVEIQRMTEYLKEEIEDTKVNQTVGMKQMTGDLKKEIADTKVNQTVGMKQITGDLKKEIELWIKDLKEELRPSSQSPSEGTPERGRGRS